MAWMSLAGWCSLGALLWVLLRWPDLFGSSTPEASGDAAPGPSKPHIIFVLQDDMGWHDVGFHNPAMIGVTKTITSLAHEGFIMTNHLTHYHCSPSRRSFLSGRLPIHHNEDLSEIAADDLDLRWSLLPDKLKKLGYRTHWIGKAHTGYLSMEHLPTHRGFDSFLGFLSGSQLYTDNDRWQDEGPFNKTTYSTELFGNRALEIVKAHPTDEPLFMYLAWQAVHSPYNEVPGYDCGTTAFAPYPGVYAQMLHATDDQTALLVDALKERGMWDNTLFVFSSDNGGVTEHGDAGNNFPLRGEKHSNWAGGYRTNTFLSGGWLPDHLRGKSSNLRMHIADWYPTLCKLGGGDEKFCSDDPPSAPQPAWTQLESVGVQCSEGRNAKLEPHMVGSLAACQSEAELMGHPYLQFAPSDAVGDKDAGGTCLTLPQCGDLVKGRIANSQVHWLDHYGEDSYPPLDGVDVWPLLESKDDYAAHTTLVISREVILHRELKLLVGQGMVGDSGAKTRPDWDGTEPPIDGWRLPNGSWVSATSVGWTCGLTYGVGAVYTPCLFDEDVEIREQQDLAPHRTTDVQRLWGMLNKSNLAAFHPRSPSSLVGPCDPDCAEQRWKAMGGVGIGPICGVPGCGDKGVSSGSNAVLVT